MLELDLLLVPFVKEEFSNLTYQEQVLYTELLDEEDQDLFSWLMGTAKPQNQEYENIIAKILAHNKKQN